MFNEKLPKYNELMWPVLKVLEKMGGSGSNDDISDKIIETYKIPEEMQAVPKSKSNDTSKLIDRIRWAQSYLKKIGMIENSERGIWSLTTIGKEVKEDEVKKLHSEYKKILSQESYKKRKKTIASQTKNEQNIEETTEKEPIIENNESEETIEKQITKKDWKEELLEVLQNMDPYAFERLSQRLLKESGLEQVEVSGGTGDGGIDGQGVLKVNLISFRVFFQCKKYKGTVSS